MASAARFSLALALALVATGVRVARADDDVYVRGAQSGGFSARAKESDAPREVTDAASLVEGLPGVHVRRLGADDSFATLSVRGSSSSEVAVVFAGVPLTGGADPSLDLGTLPLWPGSQARVYRSFAPAAIGPGSLGGTLVLDPPRLGARPRTEVWAAAGSFGAARVRIGDVRALGDARLVTALSASRADDAFSYLDPGATAQTGEDTYVTRANAGHAAVNGLVSWAVPVRWSPSTTGALTVTTLAQARRQHLPGTIYAPTPYQELESNRELVAVEASAGASAGVWSARVWGRRDGLRLRDDPRDATLGPLRTDDAIVAAGTSLGRRWAVAEPLLLEARAEASGERFAPGTYVRATQPPGASRTTAAAAVDAELRPSERWSATAAARVEAWSDASNGGDAHGEVRPTGHLGGDLALGPFTLAAHGGAVARAPSFVERYGDSGAFVGDPALRPESAWTIDGGVTFAHRAGALRVAIETAAFATWAEDLIAFLRTGAQGAARATNIGRARILGAEALVRARAFGFEARVAWTGLATANESACTAGAFGSTACERPALPGRPAHDLVADLLYRLGPATLRYGVDAVTGIYADEKQVVGVPPRVLQSAGVRLDVPGARGLRLALDLRNLFDVRVATYDGALGPAREPIGDAYLYPLPGRSVLVSARFSDARPASSE